MPLWPTLYSARKKNDDGGGGKDIIFIEILNASILAFC